jgi:hypothetical protein
MKKLIVIFAAIAMVGAFTATAMAAEWNFYGSARMATFYTTYDDGNSATADENNVAWGQQGNSRIGATVKFNDEIGGKFEMSDSFGKRLLYGTYNFGAGQLLLGQEYAPSTSFYSNSVYDSDGDLLGVGQFYIGRVPMIQVKIADFKLALMKPNVANTLGGTGTESKMPRIEASYKFKTDAFFVDVFGGYQSYDELGTSIGDQSVSSYVVGVGGGADFGPVYLKAGVHLSQNQGQYGAYNPAGMSDEAQIVTGQLKDMDGVGYLAVVGFKANDALTIEAGYGSEKNELDVDNSKADETVQYYLNLSYTITPGFFVVPEIGKIDFKEDAAGNDEGDFTYAGLKWQINF